MRLGGISQAGLRQRPKLPGEILTGLTPRESEVLQMVAEGYSSKQIAAQLSISNKAVEKHRLEIMHKLNIHNVAGLTDTPSLPE